MTAEKTPLCAEHEALGARMVEFAGWWMPVQYRGLKEEHLAVRSKVGLFDVSHMGEVFFRGPKALSSLQWMTTNDVAKLQDGQAQYSLIGNPDGGLVDDIIVYCLSRDQEYLVCVNAANVTKDYNWFKEHNRGAEITNESAKWGQIAIQGPKGWELTERVFGPLQLNSFCLSKLPYHGDHVLVARTGYTGEDGCEVFVPAHLAVTLWRELLSKGQDLGVEPIGLGARDTLRLEMKYSLYGHEIDDTTNPYGAGLGWVVKPQAKDFIGREAMTAARERGLGTHLIGFKMLDKGLARQGYSLFSFDNLEIGKVTSGTLSPTLNEAIGIAYVKSDWSREGSEFWVDIRGRKAKARVVKTPFVQPSTVKS